MPHVLEGLMRWTDRDEWIEPFKYRLTLHLEVLTEYDLDVDQLIERIGESRFRALYDFAFEDFLAADAEEGENPIDNYLKRRGWKESPSTRAYLTALRDAPPSLYEISDIVPGKSFLARDLIRGGEPLRVEERTASTMLHEWDWIATRIVTIRGRSEMGGGALTFVRKAGERLIDDANRLLEAIRAEHRSLAVERGVELPEESLEALDNMDMVLGASGFLFSAVWLRDVLDRTDPANAPRVVTTGGDDLEPLTLCFDFAPKVTQAKVRAALAREPDLRPAGRNFWNWIGTDAAEGSNEGGVTAFFGKLDDGSLVLGNLEFVGRALFLSVLSRSRAERGAELLSRLLDGLVLPPFEIDHEPTEQEVESALSDEESRELIHGVLKEHYAKSLHEPVPALGGMSPHQAIKTEQGRKDVVEWLKFIENGTLRATPEMASFDFTWMWQELGLLDRRK